MKRAIEYLQKKAEMDKAAALNSFELLVEKAVGIGDHSTGDYHENLDSALDRLVDAEDRLEILNKYFGANVPTEPDNDDPWVEEDTE